MAKGTPKKEAGLSREEREKRLSSAYNRASQTLRDRYRDEFNDLYAKAAADLGVEWRPRMRPEEKAEAELLAIFDAWPDLRDRYAAAAGDDEPEPPTAGDEGG